MTTLVADPNVVTDALARLTDMYRDKPNMRALVELFAERFAAEEAVDVELYSRQWLDDATGDLLDALGEIVGEARAGRGDELYKLWIRARIYINRSNGRIADSYFLVRLIAPDASVHYTPQYPAGYRITVAGTTVDALELLKLLKAVKPAGVRMNLFYSPADVTNVFTFASGSTMESSNSKGFGSVAHPGQGGKLRTVL